MALQCPDCAGELKLERYSGLPLEGCSSCGGVWLDPGELKRLLEDPVSLESVEAKHIPDVERASPAGPERHCPRCAGGLESHHYAYSTPVILDSCGSCSGLWVQDGELAKIAQLFQQEKAPLTPRERAALEVSELGAEHARVTERQRRLTALLSLLHRRPPSGRPTDW